MIPAEPTLSMELMKNRGNCLSQWKKQLDETPSPSVLAGILAVSPTVSLRDMAQYLRMAPKMAQEIVSGAIRDEFGWEGILSVCCLLCKRIPEFGDDAVSGDFCDFALWLIDEAFHHPERSPDFETICGMCEELLLELCSALGKGTIFDSAMVGGKAGDGGKKRSRGISSLCVDVDAYEVTAEMEPIPAEPVEEKPVPPVPSKPVETVKRSSKKVSAGMRVKKERQIHTGFSDSEEETPLRSRKRRVIRYQPEGEEEVKEGEVKDGEVKDMKDMKDGEVKDMKDMKDGEVKSEDKDIKDKDMKDMKDGEMKDDTVTTMKEAETPSETAAEKPAKPTEKPQSVEDTKEAATSGKATTISDQTSEKPAETPATHETPVVTKDDSDWTDSDWSPAPPQSPRDSWSDASSPRILHETPEKVPNSVILTFSPRDPMMTAALPRFHNETPIPGSRLWWLLRCFLECRNTDDFRRLQLLRALRTVSSAEIVQELVMAEIVEIVVSRELTEEARKLVEECVNETSEVAIRSALDETLARLREFHPAEDAGVSLMTQMIWLHLIGYRHLPENWLFNALTEIALFLFPPTNEETPSDISFTEFALSRYLEILAVLTPEHKPIFLAGTRLNVFLGVSPQLGSLTTQGLNRVLKVCEESCLEGTLLVGVRTCLKIDAIPRCDRIAVSDILRRAAKSRTEEMKTVVEQLTEEERKRVRALLSSGAKKKVVKSIEFGFSDWCGVCLE